MKTFEEWLEEFRQEINEGYEKCRMDRALSNDVEQVDTPVRILPKLDEPINYYIPPGGELPPPIIVKFRKIEPKQIGFDFYLKDWADYSNQQILFVKLLGQHLAENENDCIIKSMLENAANTVEVETKGKLTISDIQKAREKIEEYGLIPYWVVIPRKFLSKLFEESKGHILDERTGGYFMHGFIAYSTKFLRDEAVVFDKNEIIVRSTPHTVNFDNMGRPKKLIINKWCSSVPKIDYAVAKISF